MSTTSHAYATDLLEAANYAAELLALMPAAGNTIGTQVNKIQLAVALNKLRSAITKAQVEEVSYQAARIPGDAGPCPADMDDSEWLARNNID